VSPRIDVTVAVDAETPQDLALIESALRKAGLQITATLAAIGVITGEVEEDAIADLMRVDGVRGVERQGTARLPPPGSRIQ
jgi:hypothetical protein